MCFRAEEINTSLCARVNLMANRFLFSSSSSSLLQFFNLISRNELVPTLLKFRQATVFAPNNAAMRSFTGQKDQDLLLYHLGMRHLSSRSMNNPQDRERENAHEGQSLFDDCTTTTLSSLKVRGRKVGPLSSLFEQRPWLLFLSLSLSPPPS